MDQIPKTPVFSTVTMDQIPKTPVFSTVTMDQIPETPVFSTVTMDQIPPPVTEHSLPPKENRRRNLCPDDSETSCRVDVVGFVIL